MVSQRTVAEAVEERWQWAEARGLVVDAEEEASPEEMMRWREAAAVSRPAKRQRGAAGASTSTSAAGASAAGASAAGGSTNATGSSAAGASTSAASSSCAADAGSQGGETLAAARLAGAAAGMKQEAGGRAAEAGGRAAATAAAAAAVGLGTSEGAAKHASKRGLWKPPPSALVVDLTDD